MTTRVALFGLCALDHIHPFTCFYSVCSVLCCWQLSVRINLLSHPFVHCLVLSEDSVVKGCRFHLAFSVFLVSVWLVVKPYETVDLSKSYMNKIDLNSTGTALAYSLHRDIVVHVHSGFRGSKIKFFEREVDQKPKWDNRYYSDVWSQGGLGVKKSFGKWWLFVRHPSSLLSYLTWPGFLFYHHYLSFSTLWNTDNGKFLIILVYI